MALSKGWDYTDNLYYNRHNHTTVIATKGCLGLFADADSNLCLTRNDLFASLKENGYQLGTNVGDYKLTKV